MLQAVSFPSCWMMVLAKVITVVMIGGGVDGTGGNNGVGDKIVGCRIGDSVERGSLSVCCVENITVLQGNVKTFLNLKVKKCVND